MGSGKTTAVVKLQEFLRQKEKEVLVVSEEELLGQHKNVIFSDSKHEKEVRGRLKSEVVRQLTKENVVICDGLNYIKGFRYELYCASKNTKTTQVTIQCDVSREDAETFNGAREGCEQYSPDILSQLIQRYEAPISQNRWDSPLFLVLKDGHIDCDGIYDALFNKKPPPPNQSTQNGSSVEHKLCTRAGQADTGCHLRCDGRSEDVRRCCLRDLRPGSERESLSQEKLHSS